MKNLLLLFLLAACAAARAQTIDSMPAASSVDSTDLFIDDQASDATTYHKASAAQLGNFIFGLSLSGDLSGTLASPTVAKFNGQLPSYYLNFANLTNKPTTAAGYGIANGSVLDAWGIKTPYAGTFTLTTGKTFNVTNTLTLSGTDGSTLNIAGGGTLGTGAYAPAPASVTGIRKGNGASPDTAASSSDLQTAIGFTLDTDPTLAADSNTRVPSQAAVEQYVLTCATSIAGPSIVYGGDRPSIPIFLAGYQYLVDAEELCEDYAGTITLPASPNDGDTLVFICGGEGSGYEDTTWHTYPVTFDAGSNFICDTGATTFTTTSSTPLVLIWTYEEYDAADPYDAYWAVSSLPLTKYDFETLPP